MATTAQLKRRAENQKLLENKFVQAALEMISLSEGTNGDYHRMVYGVVTSSPLHPQLVGKKDVRLPNLTRFPNALVRVNSRGLFSSAAGKYQILKKTYLGASAAMGLTDFSQATQDLIAVELIRQRGAIPFLLKGDIGGALTETTINKEWASFAGAGYGQGEHSLSKLVGWFNAALGGGASTNDAGNGSNSPGKSGGSGNAVIIALLAFGVFF